MRKLHLRRQCNLRLPSYLVAITVPWSATSGKERVSRVTRELRLGYAAHSSAPVRHCGRSPLPHSRPPIGLGRLTPVRRVALFLRSRCHIGRASIVYSRLRVHKPLTFSQRRLMSFSESCLQSLRCEIQASCSVISTILCVCYVTGEACPSSRFGLVGIKLRCSVVEAKPFLDASDQV